MKPLTIIMLLGLLTYTNLTLAQTCNPHIVADAPDSRYRLNTDGTALDKKTGLLWMRCTLGQKWVGSTCMVHARHYTWQAALQAAESKMFAGRRDWRLPNRKKLQSLVERRCFDPAINSTAFPNVNYRIPYWSSSPVANSSYGAWITSFRGGYDYWEVKGNNFSVRLVRSGQ